MIDLVRLLLNHKFYEENKYKLLKEMMPSSLYDLYDLIIASQDKYQRDLSIDELKALYKVTYPVTTEAKKDLVFQVLDKLPEVGEDAAKEVLEKAWIIELGRQITEAGTEIVQGQTTSFEKARTIITKINEGELSSRDELQAVSSELEDVLDALNITTKWNFNLGQLKTIAKGIGPGTFSIIFARVEVGKTSLWISLCAAPKGFADQGALVHCYCNEESAQRTQGRAIMSYTGMPLLELLNNKEEARGIYSRIKDKIKFFECKGMEIGQIHNHIDRHHPDIVVIDQLDKLSIKGVFQRRDEMLGNLYSTSRDIGARCGSAIIAISQANADGEGKHYLSSANLADSRTSKAAEGDLVLGIGKGQAHDEYQRTINVIKNKITGNHTDIVCYIKPDISRYID